MCVCVFHAVQFNAHRSRSFQRREPRALSSVRAASSAQRPTRTTCPSHPSDASHRGATRTTAASSSERARRVARKTTTSLDSGTVPSQASVALFVLALECFVRRRINTNKQRSHLNRDLLEEECCPVCSDENRTSVGSAIFSFISGESFLLSLHVSGNFSLQTNILQFLYFKEVYGGFQLCCWELQRKLLTLVTLELIWK